MLWIGDPTTGEVTDLLSFGVTMGGLFAAVALVAWRATSRRLLVAIAVVQVIVILGYFAFAELRTPAFEVKASPGG